MFGRKVLCATARVTPFLLALCLMGVAADMEDALTEPAPDLDIDRFRRGEWLIRRRLALRSMVRLDLQGWLSRPLTPSDSVAASRAYARLESLGLLERVRDGGKTSHLLLTDAGKALAEELSRE